MYGQYTMIFKKCTDKTLWDKKNYTIEFIMCWSSTAGHGVCIASETPLEKTKVLLSG